MTCVWDGIATALTTICGVPRHAPGSLVTYLQQNNIKTCNVTWNGEMLSPQQLNENHEAIKNIDIRSINNGYLTSSCEPVLFLVSQLWKVDIYVNFNSNHQVYKYTGIVDSPIKTLRFAANASHFSMS